MNSINDLINDATKRCHEEDQDTMVVLLGPRGHGKTTAAIIMQFLFSSKFGLDRIGWEYDEHRKKLLTDLPLGSGYHADEIRFHSMDFRTSMGIECDKLLGEIRPFNHFTTWSSPRIHKILGTFLEYAHYLLYFYEKGVCVALKRSDDILKGNAFGIGKEVDKIRNRKTFKKYFVTPAKKNRLYLGRFRFPQFTSDLTPKFYDEYKALRLESTRNRFVYETEEINLTPELRRYLVGRARFVGVPIKKLSYIMEKTEATISKDISINNSSGNI